MFVFQLAQNADGQSNGMAHNWIVRALAFLFFSFSSSSLDPEAHGVLSILAVYVSL